MYKINDFLSEDSIKRLTNKHKKAILNAIITNTPIFFTGVGAVEKTTFARELQKKDIAAYAPEMVCFIELKKQGEKA